MNVKHLKVIEGNLEVLSVQMLDEIRAVIKDSKYDNMTFSTLLGVLEMAKLEQWEENKI